jgi:hypothetical protein
MQLRSKAALFAAATLISLSAMAPAQAQMFRNGGFHTVGRHLVAPAPVDSVFDVPPATPGNPPPFDIYRDVYASDRNYGAGSGPRVHAPRVSRAPVHKYGKYRVRTKTRRN